LTEQSRSQVEQLRAGPELMEVLRGLDAGVTPEESRRSFLDGARASDQISGVGAGRQPFTVAEHSPNLLANRHHHVSGDESTQENVAVGDESLGQCVGVVRQRCRVNEFLHRYDPLRCCRGQWWVM